MKSLRAAAIILSLTAFVILIGAAIEGLVFRGLPARAWELAGQAVILVVMALTINGAADIASAVISLLGEQAQALRIIVGRRDKR